MQRDDRLRNRAELGIRTEHLRLALVCRSRLGNGMDGYATGRPVA